MMHKIRNDFLPLLTALLPLVYSAFVWKELPNKVPVHWNLQGEIDRYGSKAELLILVFLPLFMLILFQVLPLFDKKGKIEQMGKKFNRIKFFVIALLSALTLYILNVSKSELLTNQNVITLFMGVLFLILGNYAKTLKKNYIIGLRTPWTLKDEVVWKETHKFSGVIWFIGGLLIILSSLVLIQKVNMIVFVIVLVVIVIVPTIYSYIVYKKQQSYTVQNK